MAYDKIVDSAKLDSAISATANAIRSKTGSSAKIAWDESSGFSTAIKTQSKSVTPKASSQTIKPDAGYLGLSKVTVNGDSDLKAANIAKGINIFGITGTFEGGSKVARGSITISNTGILINAITVNGLGFKPSFIIMYVKPSTVTNWQQYDGYAPWDGVALYTVYDNGTTSTVYPIMGEEYNYDDETGEEWTYEYVSASTGGNLIITPTNDGFTISAQNSIAFWEHEAQFVAIA